MQKSATFVGRENPPILSLVQHRTRSIFDEIGKLFGHQSVCVIMVIVYSERKIFVTYLFCLLLYNIYFRSLDVEKIMQVSFCDMDSAVVYS